MPEGVAIPLEDHRAGRVRCRHIVERNALRQREERPLADLEMPPLLGGERRYRLKALEPALAPFEDRRIDIERIRAAPGPYARGCQKGAISDPEELGVFAAAHRQPLIFDKSARLMLIDDERNIAVAAVHMGGLSVDVLRKLRDRQIERPVQLEGRHGAGARGVQLLDGMQKIIWRRCGRGGFGSADRRQRQ